MSSFFIVLLFQGGVGEFSYPEYSMYQTPMIKSSTDELICVSDDTAEVLFERGFSYYAEGKSYDCDTGTYTGDVKCMITTDLVFIFYGVIPSTVDVDIGNVNETDPPQINFSAKFESKKFTYHVHGWTFNNAISTFEISERTLRNCSFMADNSTWRVCW